MPSISPFPGLDPWLEEHWGDVHTLREPLPNIRIPLRPTDGDAVLQLQPLFNEIYRKGRYSSIDYGRPPNPRLSAEDELWAAEVLRQTS